LPIYPDLAVEDVVRICEVIEFIHIGVRKSPLMAR
jgi:hypothetical protein